MSNKKILKEDRREENVAVDMSSNSVYGESQMGGRGGCSRHF